MNELQKYREQYNELNCKKNLSGKKALEVVKEDGHALRYVQEQTPEICLEAVKQNGYALRYVQEQTPEICLEAVKEDGYTLQYVREQTPELCLEAVKQTINALSYVNSKFFEQDKFEQLVKIEILSEAITLVLNILEIEKTRYEKMNWSETEEYKILVDTIKRLADYIEVK